MVVVEAIEITEALISAQDQIVNLTAKAHTLVKTLRSLKVKSVVETVVRSLISTLLTKAHVVAQKVATKAPSQVVVKAFN